MRGISIILILLFSGCSSVGEKPSARSNNIKNQQKIENKRNVEQDSSKIEYIYQLQSKNGEPIGDVYAKMINNEVFTELFVLKIEFSKTDTLYHIKKSEFRNKKGIDLSFDSTGFFGYHFGLKKDDYFEITYLSDNGSHESDIITIEYNTQENIMEILKTP